VDIGPARDYIGLGLRLQMPESAGVDGYTANRSHEPVEHVLFWGEQTPGAEAVTPLLEHKAVSLAGHGATTRAADGGKQDARRGQAVLLDGGGSRFVHLTREKLGDTPSMSGQLSGSARRWRSQVKPQRRLSFIQLLPQLGYPNRPNPDRIIADHQATWESFASTGKRSSRLLAG